MCCHLVRESNHILKKLKSFRKLRPREDSDRAGHMTGIPVDYISQRADHTAKCFSLHLSWNKTKGGIVISLLLLLSLFQGHYHL